MFPLFLAESSIRFSTCIHHLRWRCSGEISYQISQTGGADIAMAGGCAADLLNVVKAGGCSTDWLDIAKAGQWDIRHTFVGYCR